MMKKNDFINKKIIPLELIFSFFVIITILFLITIICLRINLEFKQIKKNSEATIIITNMIENINSKTYSEFENYISEVSIIGISKKVESGTQNISIKGDECTDKFLGTEIPKGYNIEIEIDTLEDSFNTVKSININVKFLINNKEYNQEMKTSLKRDCIPDCNAPIISDEYLSDIGINTKDYDVIPIKYSEKENSYIVTTLGDEEWYNYYSKEWARILVFPKNNEYLKNQFVGLKGIIKRDIIYNNRKFDINDYIYVWIPNFSIKDNTSYFRYNTGKNAIKMDLLYFEEQHLNMNIIGEKIEDISSECSFEGIYGVWRKLDNVKDIYYSNFCFTKYAPINIH